MSIMDGQTSRRHNQIAPAFKVFNILVDEQHLSIAVHDFKLDAPNRFGRQAKLHKRLNIIGIIRDGLRPVNHRVLIAAKHHHANIDRQHPHFIRAESGAFYRAEGVGINFLRPGLAFGFGHFLAFITARAFALLRDVIKEGLQISTVIPILAVQQKCAQSQDDSC